MPMKTTIYLGADHAGFALKEAVKGVLKNSMDLSPAKIEGDDYPLAARKVAMAVLQDKNALGLLFCGTGHGMDIAANRFRGMRAIVARTDKDAKLAREHNHANALVLGGWITKPAAAKKIIAAFLKAKPSKEKRHVRRVKQLDDIRD
ncbi:RpiB/LacA/LacB family sugar-phosphate isomerase [Patescibacteria group bacterium]|nr:RpiB/LacA/LacB family sugar-phosphate isomerase [Patescibacteria group bacterium]